MKKPVKIDPKKKLERRIKAEIKKLEMRMKDVPEDQAQLANGLIQRAAYMRVTLEDYEDDMNSFGFVEMFQQSEKCEPYERERPVVRLYNSMMKNYSTVMRQLADLVPNAPNAADDLNIDPKLKKLFGGRGG